MQVLCFDIGSGGISAARVDRNLDTIAQTEIVWDPARYTDGRLVLSISDIQSVFMRVAQSIDADTAPAALSIACFMHSFVILDSRGDSRSPVFTWWDTTGCEGEARLRHRFGDEFHERTGCRYHPMFPAIKLASMAIQSGDRVMSPKAWLIEELTGSAVEDFGMAAASGLLNIRSAAWDEEILTALRMHRDNLPSLENPHATVGQVTDDAARRYGIRSGTRVISGSGDGFLASVGSGCEVPQRIAITLGTSAAVRQMVDSPVLNPSAGTFCYRADSGRFILGCASSNGGNVLDWARRQFGPAPEITAAADVPIFLPWINGERSFEWNPALRGGWHGVSSQHTSAHLMRSVMEGVVFNLAHYAEVIQRLSGVAAQQFVLSGNGFLDPALAPILAGLLPAETLLPADSGLASLKGAAICAWHALGHDPGAATAQWLDEAQRVVPIADTAVKERYARFKALRLGRLRGI